MSIATAVNVLRVAPSHPGSKPGSMSLADHLREARARLIRCALVLVVAFFVALPFYDQLLDLVLGPYNQAQGLIGADTVSTAYVAGATGPLMLNLKLCGTAAVVVASPYWLWQAWAFVVPGLLAREKRWSKVFAAVAGPLFIAGVALGYYVLPKGLGVLIGFTPDGMENLVEFGDYFSFFSRMLLVFGIAVEIPFFLVLLNLAGVVTGAQLGKHRSIILMAAVVFAAVATPSTDPFSMLMLAIPMMVLFILAEVITRLIDRRRASRALAQVAPWTED
ncbi:sec-independent protein translocase protein TatC [Nocardioides exalbidus]|uniref:Sec-independent protein translocase protein TatC n=1 Tax=Nocardioides exalbidus TaxID=402596 RepID=A0A1H4WBU0_9ACTN|nr:twin-arginine translocase subunit TatC [Nocardioides exalbidus]SEC89964.1 sec-independent protein translocase protein TatC [Nocardioides exalbidus]